MQKCLQLGTCTSLCRNACSSGLALSTIPRVHACEYNLKSHCVAVWLGSESCGCAGRPGDRDHVSLQSRRLFTGDLTDSHIWRAEGHDLALTPQAIVAQMYGDHAQVLLETHSRERIGNCCGSPVCCVQCTLPCAALMLTVTNWCRTVKASDLCILLLLPSACLTDLTCISVMCTVCFFRQSFDTILF